MLTLINEKRKLYLWIINIVILITMFIALIEIFFVNQQRIIFLACYSIFYCLILLGLVALFINIFKNNVLNRIEWLYVLPYLIDFLLFIVSFILACLKQLTSFYLLCALITSILRLSYFNLTWKFNAK